MLVLHSLEYYVILLTLMSPCQPHAAPAPLVTDERAADAALLLEAGETEGWRTPHPVVMDTLLTEGKSIFDHLPPGSLVPSITVREVSYDMGRRHAAEHRLGQAVETFLKCAAAGHTGCQVQTCNDGHLTLPL